jgi:hypothetical protein
MSLTEIFNTSATKRFGRWVYFTKVILKQDVALERVFQFRHSHLFLLPFLLLSYRARAEPATIISKILEVKSAQICGTATFCGSGKDSAGIMHKHTPGPISIFGLSTIMLLSKYRI